jgi:uncharacterized protein (DUF885 family)
VPDDVNALAQEYFDYLLSAWPTWGHIMGNYEHADLFDDASRAGEDEEILRRREFAARAEAIPAAGLSTQDAITREMIVFDGRRNADILEARLAEFAVDPIFGPVAGLPVYMPKFSIPNAKVADAMIAKVEGMATHFRDLADRSLEGVARSRSDRSLAGQADRGGSSPRDCRADRHCRSGCLADPAPQGDRDRGPAGNGPLSRRPPR